MHILRSCPTTCGKHSNGCASSVHTRATGHWHAHVKQSCACTYWYDLGPLWELQQQKPSLRLLGEQPCSTESMWKRLYYYSSMPMIRLERPTCFESYELRSPRRRHPDAHLPLRIIRVSTMLLQLLPAMTRRRMGRPSDLQLWLCAARLRALRSGVASAGGHACAPAGGMGACMHA